MKPKFELTKEYFIEKEDDLNWVLRRYRVREKGKNKGSTYAEDITYHISILSAFNSACDRIPLQTTTNKELKQVLDKLIELKKDLPK